MIPKEIKASPIFGEFSPEELLRLSSSSVPLENSFAAVEHLAGWRPGAFQIRLKDKKSQQKKLTNKEENKKSRNALFLCLLDLKVDLMYICVFYVNVA